MNIDTMTRRGFLRIGARASLFSTLAGLGMLGAVRPARAAVADFKALVCVYLYGGNDGNNLIVPLDAAHYTPYTQIRGGLALSTAASTLTPARSAMLHAVANPVAQSFAFHYGMPEIDAWFGQGKVAVVLNVGSLRQPLTKAQYAAGTAVPPQLFSHADQTMQMQAGTPSPSGTGWGGRLVDVLGTGGHLDAVSVGTNGLFIEGAATHGNLVPSNGQLALAGMSFWPQSAADARKAALVQILGADTGNVLGNAANKALSNGIQLISDLQAASAVTPLKTVFPSNSLASQLKVVAQLIDLRAAQGPGRQVYFVSLGGFDTHSGQSYQQWSQTSLDSTLGALKAAGLQNSQFDSDAALLKTLQNQSTSSVGRMQALEVGNQIAENQSEQLMKLRQLMMADMQSKAAFQGAQVQADATRQANSDKFFGQSQVTSDGVTF